jgi:transposase InsO family protein
VPRTADDEAALTADIIALAKQYGRYGYRRITAMLRTAGWLLNKKRVERIWRREGAAGLHSLAAGQCLRSTVSKRLPPSKKKLSSIANTGS